MKTAKNKMWSIEDAIMDILKVINTGDSIEFKGVDDDIITHVIHKGAWSGEIATYRIPMPRIGGTGVRFKIAYLKHKWIGMHFSSYDSFNGSSEYFEIENVIRTPNHGVKVCGTSSWGKPLSATISEDEQEVLLCGMEVRMDYEIDHCSCHRTISIH